MEAILDAAAEVFAEQSFEAASMEAIAERAGTSIGSVYQFFEKKQDVFVALAHRCMEDIQRLSADLTSGVAFSGPWPELVDSAVDTFVTMAQEHPGLRALNTNPQLYGLFEEADRAQARALIEQTARFLPAHIDNLEPEDAYRVATMVITTLNAAVFFASRSSAGEATALITESKRMLRAYIATYADTEG